MMRFQPGGGVCIYYKFLKIIIYFVLRHSFTYSVLELPHHATQRACWKWTGVLCVCLASETMESVSLAM